MATKNPPPKYQSVCTDMTYDKKGQGECIIIDACAVDTLPEPKKAKQKPKVKKPCNVPDTNLMLACLVTLCFHPLFGACATYLSITAARAYRDGRPKVGERRALFSVIVSLLGIVFTVVLVMTLVLWVTIGKYRQNVQS